MSFNNNPETAKFYNILNSLFVKTISYGRMDRGY